MCRKKSYIGLMTNHEFRQSLDTLGIRRVELARWLGQGSSSIQRYLDGSRPVPAAIGLLLELLQDRPELVSWFRDRAAFAATAKSGRMRSKDGADAEEI